jgi:hypothetical protein
MIRRACWVLVRVAGVAACGLVIGAGLRGAVPPVITAGYIVIVIVILASAGR